MSREKQKRRTRTAILAAATELIRAGREPTVAEVADAADVSRATAYSYFPSQQELLLEVTLEVRERDQVIEALEAACAACGDDVIGRWEAFCRLLHDLVVRNEPVYRMMLRAQQDLWLEANRRGDADSVVVRQARRLPAIERVLAPLHGRISESSYEQLVEGLAMVSGTEALVVLKDICGASSAQALERMLWAGHTMIEATAARSA
ncbi:MAG: TetR/AcrR family transcriptional regulator [Actinomycetota bacterium]|nr:TetR/AcrR family transcriptional regulator [Actinomycetota bacterium]